MRRSKAIAKAIVRLDLRAVVCDQCGGTGRWVFFENSGPCGGCRGVGILCATSEEVKRINDYIEHDLDIDEMLRTTVP